MDVILSPALMGEQQEAEVVSWLVADGARVEQDQIIAALETGKAVLEVAAPVGGALQILAAQGEVVGVGAVIGRIA